jgi:hypothetical protein
VELSDTVIVLELFHETAIIAGCPAVWVSVVLASVQSSFAQSFSASETVRMGRQGWRRVGNHPLPSRTCRMVTL